MIVKKVANPNKSASKAVRIRALAGYIRAPETESATEKCLYAGARGFLCDAPEAQTEEMLALARDAPRSRDPIVHWVLSWHEDEEPTPAQVEELVDLLLEELDVAEHQAIYGLHADTDNRHLHVMLNRVHPDTLRAVEINGGFDIKALHRACARIEHAQGWRAERNACYRVNAANDIEPRARAAAERMARPPQRLVDAEHRSGEQSAARMAIEEGAPLIEAAKSWEALHRALAERDMRYVRSGSGAAVQVGEVFVKASAVSRKATLKRVEERLGPYRAPPAADASRAPVRERDGDLPGAALSPLMDPMWARPLIEAARSWHALHETLAAQGFRYVRRGSGALIVAGEGEAEVSMKASAVSRRAALRQLEARLGPFEAPGAEALPEQADPSERQAELEARHEAWAQWEAQCEPEARALAERQREEREALFRERCWRGRQLELNLHRSLLAAAHAREKAALEEAHRRAREALRARCLRDKDPARWRGDPAIAFLWRTRHLEPRALEPASQATKSPEAQPPQDIRDYHGRAVGSWVVYATRAQHERGEVAFVDRGKRVTLHERDSDAAALAAMQLAQQKWGRFRARGSEAHKRRSAWLAARHGLNLANPELQGLIAQYRRELGRDRPPPRLGERGRAALLRPPQAPLAEPTLRAPPELVQRTPAAEIHPPQGPLVDPALGAPPQAAPRPPSTLTRPPPAPRVEMDPGAPPRLEERERMVLRNPPAAPSVEAQPGAPPELPRRAPTAVTHPPQGSLVGAAVEAPPQVASRPSTMLARPPAAPHVEVKLETPARLTPRTSTALVRPPSSPRVEARLGVPPELPERVSVSVTHPPQGPLVDPALEAPPPAAPRPPSTLTRPPAAPRVEMDPGAPPRLEERERMVLRNPPAAPSVEAPPGAPPELPRRAPTAVTHPPQGSLVGAAVETPPQVAPRPSTMLARPPATPHVEVKLETPARLTPRTSTALVRPPSSPRVEAGLGVPPELPERVSVSVTHPPQSPLVGAAVEAPPPGRTTTVDDAGSPAAMAHGRGGRRGSTCTPGAHAASAGSPTIATAYRSGALGPASAHGARAGCAAERATRAENRA